MSRPRRILLSTFGSAGDLFPMMPAARVLQRQHDVRLAVPRALGLYARAFGLPVYSLGDGVEMRVLDDDVTVTTRFGGWASWRRTMALYVGPALRADVARLGQVFATWRPDVVVTMSFATAARVAAHLHGLPHLDLTIYPQHARLAATRSFGLAGRGTVADLCAAHRGRPAGPATVAQLTWGGGPDGLVLHDPALLGAAAATGAPTGGPAAPVAGFPYWDAVPTSPGDLAVAERWLDRSSRPVALITLGSFLGARRRRVWVEAADACARMGVRALLVGPRRRADDLRLGGGDDLLAVGFVPLSDLASRVDVVVHHGGVGTLFGTLRAGRPAVVVPQAFDQPFNAALVERAGVGVGASLATLAPALATALQKPRLASTARRVAAALIPAEAVTRCVVWNVLERAA